MPEKKVVINKAKPVSENPKPLFSPEELISKPEEQGFQNNAFPQDSKFDGRLSSPLFDQNEIRANNQGYLDELGNGGAKFLGNFVKSAAELPAIGYGVGSAIVNRDFSKIYDNDAISFVNKTYEDFTKQFPNYEPKKEKDYNAWQKLGTSKLWCDTLPEALGFVAEMAAEAYYTGGASVYTKGGARGLKLLSQLALKSHANQLISAVSKGENILEAATKLNKAVVFKNATSLAKSSAVTGIHEGAAEARGTKLETLQRLKEEKMKELGIEDENLIPEQDKADILDKANKAGNVNFALNAALSTVTNAFEIQALFKPLKYGKSIAGKLIKNAAGELVEETAKTGLEKTIKYGKNTLNALKLPLVEAGEEGLQGVFNYASSDYFAKRDEDRNKSSLLDIYESIGEGFKQSVGTTEGQTEMLIGAIIGSGMGGASYLLNRNSRVFEKKQVENAIKLYNENKDFRLISDTIGEKYKARIQNAAVNQGSGDAKQEAILNNDDFEYKNEDHDVLFAKVDSLLKTDRFDEFEDHAKDLTSLSYEEVNKLEGSKFTSEQEKNDKIASLVKKANEIKGLHEKITSFVLPISDDLKDRMIYNASNTKDLEEREDKLSAEILAFTASKGIPIDYNQIKSDFENNPNRISVAQETLNKLADLEIPKVGNDTDVKTSSNNILNGLEDYKQTLVTNTLDKIDSESVEKTLSETKAPARPRTEKGKFAAFDDAYRQKIKDHQEKVKQLKDKIASITNISYQDRLDIDKKASDLLRIAQKREALYRNYEEMFSFADLVKKGIVSENKTKKNEVAVEEPEKENLESQVSATTEDNNVEDGFENSDIDFNGQLTPIYVNEDGSYSYETPSSENPPNPPNPTQPPNPDPTDPNPSSNTTNPTNPTPAPVTNPTTNPVSNPVSNTTNNSNPSSNQQQTNQKTQRSSIATTFDNSVSLINAIQEENSKKTIKQDNGYYTIEGEKYLRVSRAFKKVFGKEERLPASSKIKVKDINTGLDVETDIFQDKAIEQNSAKTAIAFGNLVDALFKSAIARINNPKNIKLISYESLLDYDVNTHDARSKELYKVVEKEEFEKLKEEIRKTVNKLNEDYQLYTDVNAFNEKVNIAGEIDVIGVSKKDGKITIFDVKNSKNSFDSNKVNYSIQLQAYTSLLENKKEYLKGNIDNKIIFFETTHFDNSKKISNVKPPVIQNLDSTKESDQVKKFLDNPLFKGHRLFNFQTKYLPEDQKKFDSQNELRNEYYSFLINPSSVNLTANEPFVVYNDNGQFNAYVKVQTYKNNVRKEEVVSLGYLATKNQLENQFKQLREFKDASKNYVLTQDLIDRYKDWEKDLINLGKFQNELKVNKQMYVQLTIKDRISFNNKATLPLSELIKKTPFAKNGKPYRVSENKVFELLDNGDERLVKLEDVPQLGKDGVPIPGLYFLLDEFNNRKRRISGTTVNLNIAELNKISVKITDLLEQVEKVNTKEFTEKAAKELNNLIFIKNQTSQNTIQFEPDYFKVKDKDGVVTKEGNIIKIRISTKGDNNNIIADFILGYHVTIEQDNLFQASPLLRKDQARLKIWNENILGNKGKISISNKKITYDDFIPLVNEEIFSNIVVYPNSSTATKDVQNANIIVNDSETSILNGVNIQPISVETQSLGETKIVDDSLAGIELEEDLDDPTDTTSTKVTSAPNINQQETKYDFFGRPIYPIDKNGKEYYPKDENGNEYYLKDKSGNERPIVLDRTMGAYKYNNLLYIYDKEGKLKNPEYADVPFKLQTNNDLTVQDLEKVRKTLKRILPKEISIDSIESLIGRITLTGQELGAYLNNTIYLAKAFEKGTEYHEAFHAVYRSLLTPYEKQYYLNLAKKELGDISREEIAIFRTSNPNYRRLSDEQVVDRIAEEHLADKFQQYMNNRPQALFDKIFRYLKNLISFFTKRENTISSLFKKIENGGFRNATVLNVEGDLVAHKLLTGVPSTIAHNLIYSLVSSKVAYETKTGDVNDTYMQLVTEEEVTNAMNNALLAYTKDTPSDPKLLEELKRLGWRVLPKDSSKMANAYLRPTALDKETGSQKATNNAKIILDQANQAITNLNDLLAIENIENDFAEENENSDKNRDYDANMFENGGINKISKVLKIFLSTIPSTEKLPNGFEVPTVLPLSAVNKVLNATLVGCDSIKEMETRMEKAAQNDNNMALILAKYKDVTDSLNKTDVANTNKPVVKLLNNNFKELFYFQYGQKEYIESDVCLIEGAQSWDEGSKSMIIKSDFSNPKTRLYNATRQSQVLVEIQRQKNNFNEAISNNRNQFKESLKAISGIIARQNFNFTEKDKALLIDINEFQRNLSNIGIDLEKNTILKLNELEDGYAFPNTLSMMFQIILNKPNLSKSKFIDEALKATGDSNFIYKNPFLDYVEEDNIIGKDERSEEKKEIDTRLKVIGLANSNLRYDSQEGNFQNAEKKSQYAYLFRFLAAKRARQAAKIMEENPEYYKYNFFSDKNMSGVTLRGFGGIDYTDKNADGSTFKNISHRELLLAKQLLYNNNTFVFAVHEAASTMTTVKVSPEIAKIQFIEKDKATPALIKAFKGIIDQDNYVKDKMLSLVKDKGIEGKLLDLNSPELEGLSLNIHYSIPKGTRKAQVLSEEHPTVAYNYNTIHHSDIENINSGEENLGVRFPNSRDAAKLTDKELEAEINQYLEDEYQAFGKMLPDYELTSKELFDVSKEDDLRKQVKEYLAKDFIIRHSYQDIIRGEEGNLNIYKNDGDVTKRGKGSIAAGAAPVIYERIRQNDGSFDIEEEQDFTIAINETVIKDLPKFGKTEVDDGGSYDTIERAYKVAKGLGKLTFHTDLLFQVLLENEYLKNYYRDLNTVKTSKAKSSQQYKEVLKRVNKGIQHYRDLELIKKTEEKFKGIDKKSVDNIVTKANKEITNLLISRKFVLVDGSIYAKTAVINLNRETTSKWVESNGIGEWMALEGRDHLHGLLNKMYANKVDVVFTTSSMKGRKENVNYLEDGKYPDVLKTVKAKNNTFRLQMENPSGKLKITDGTQLIQLIDSELDNDTVIDYNGKETTLQTLRDDYQANLAKIREISLNYVKEDLKNVSGFYDYLVDNLISSQGDPNMIEYLSKNAQGLPNYSIDLPNIQNKFEEMFIAYFNSNAFRQKVPGLKLTLVPSEGLAKTDGTPLKLHNYVKGADGKYTFEYAEVLLGAEVLVQNGLTEKEVLDNPALANEIMKMLGYRIPTQSHHSMLPFKVVGFLPSFMGSVVACPSEIVALSGADFDVDSLYAQRKEFTKHRVKFEKDGETRYKTVYSVFNRDKNKKINPNATQEELDQVEFNDFISQIKKNNNKLSDKFDELKDTLKEGQTKLDLIKDLLFDFGYPSTVEELVNHKDYSNYQYNKYAVNNSLLENRLAFFETVQDENVIEGMFTPASIDKLKQVKEILSDIFEKEPTFSYNSLLTQFNHWRSNTISKKNVGIAAVANAISAYLTKLNYKFETTKIKDGAPVVTISKTPEIDGYSSEGINKINEEDIVLVKKDGKVTILLDEKGDYKKTYSRKADSLSTTLSVATDDIKELICAALNLTDKMVPTFTFMLANGYGLTRSSLFISNPILRKASTIKNANPSFKLKEILGDLIANNIKKVESDLARVENKLANYKIFVNEEAATKYGERPEYRNTYSAGKDSEIDSIIAKYKLNLNDVIEHNNKGFGLDYYSVENYSENGLIPLTSQDMLNTLQKPNLITEIQIAKRFIQFEEMSDKFFSPFREFLALNRGIDSKFYAAEELLDKIDTTDNIDFKQIIDNDKVVSQNISATRTIISGASDYTLLQNYSVKTHIDAIVGNIFTDYKKSENKANYIKGFVNYLGLQKMREYLSIKEGEGVFDKYLEKGIPLINKKDKNNIVERYKTLLLSHPELAQNQFIANLVVNEKNGVSILEFNTRMKGDSSFKEAIANAFIDLQLNENLDVQSFATALYNTILFKDGLKFRNGTYISIINPTIMKNYSNGLLELTDRDELAKLLEKTNIEHYTELYISNYNYRTLVKTPDFGKYIESGLLVRKENPDKSIVYEYDKSKATDKSFIKDSFPKYSRVNYAKENWVLRRNQDKTFSLINVAEFKSNSAINPYVFKDNKQKNIVLSNYFKESLTNENTNTREDLENGVENPIKSVQKPVEQPKVEPSKVNQTSSKTQEISSNEKGLYGALTNPTEISFKKGNITEKYEFEYQGEKGTAEQIYQKLKVGNVNDELRGYDYNLMVDIIKAKFAAYPRLKEAFLKELNKGVVFTHQPTNKPSIWHTNNGKDYFIKALTEAATGKKVFNPFTLNNQIEEVVKPEDNNTPNGLDETISTSVDWSKFGKQKLSTAKIIGFTQLNKILKKLSKKFGLPTEYVSSKGNWFGRYNSLTGKVEINTNYDLRLDTPFHEFAHPFIEAIRKTNPELYNRLAQGVIEEGNILSQIQQLYPELSYDEAVEEAVVQSLGELAANKIDNKTLIDSILDFINEIKNKIANILGIPRSMVILDVNTTLSDLADMMTDDSTISLDVLGLKDNYLQENEDLLNQLVAKGLIKLTCKV